MDLVLFLGFSEDSAFMASLETRDKEEGTKQLKKAEKRESPYFCEVVGANH